MEKKTETITIRIDAEMKKLLEKVASQDRRKLSQYVYILIENDLMAKGYAVPCVYVPLLEA